MAQYISKSALVEEIERRIKTNKECMLGLRNLDYYQGKVDALNDTISFINSLQKEPKECMYSKDNYTDEDRKVLFGDCEEECEFNKKEEPVSEDLEKAAKEWLRPQLDKSYVNYGEVKMMELTHFDGYAMLDAIEFGAWWQQEKDSIPAEYLEELINKLSKQFPEVSFAKLSRIAVRVAKWQKEHLWKPADGDNLPIIDREVIALLDNGKVVFAHRPPEYWDGKNIITDEVTRYYPNTYDKGGWNIPDTKYWLDVELPKEIEL